MTRKTIILFTMVGLFSGRIHAQQKTEVSGNVDYVRKVETYRKMRNSGMVLSVIGSVFVVAGSVVMYNLKEEGTYPYETSITNGTAQIIVGSLCLGAGVPLWIVGGINHRKYSTKIKNLSLKLNVTPQTQGMILTYKF
jgi:hypothetical protein